MMVILYLSPFLFQFRGAYRRLIGRDAVVIQHTPSANIISLDEEENEEPHIELAEETLTIPNDDFFDILDLSSAKPKASFADDVTTYIAGFVVRKLKNLKCEICFDRLFSSSVDADEHYRSPYDLIEMRDCGGLIKPSLAVIDICKRTEHVIRHIKEEDLCDRSLLLRIKTSILSDYDIPFPDDHESGLNSHAVQLTKSVIEKYVKVRLHHLSQQSNEKDRGLKIRSKLTKSIFFPINN